MNIYVGNLSYEVEEKELEALFAEHGAVVSAKVIRDMHTGRSRGFGFVEMESPEQGQTAIDKLNGSECSGRQLVVNVARPREQRGGPR